MGRKLMAGCVALAVGLTTAGCASAPRTEETGGELGDSPQTMVEVTNNNELLVTVEALSSGPDQTLGQVAANGTETFPLPQSIDASGLRIQVEPIGSTETYVSPQILVSRGDVVTVRVESNLDLTTVSVR